MMPCRCPDFLSLCGFATLSGATNLGIPTFSLCIYVCSRVIMTLDQSTWTNGAHWLLLRISTFLNIVEKRYLCYCSGTLIFLWLRCTTTYYQREFNFLISHWVFRIPNTMSSNLRKTVGRRVYSAWEKENSVFDILDSSFSLRLRFLTAHNSDCLTVFAVPETRDATPLAFQTIVHGRFNSSSPVFLCTQHHPQERDRVL
jgi:hypothetical protein